MEEDKQVLNASRWDLRTSAAFEKWEYWTMSCDEISPYGMYKVCDG